MNRSHPLRRPSTGSLSNLARSTDRSTASPSGLDFLQPALAELNDEASTLAGNVAHLTELHNALSTFNESFAGYLYALKMNAFCVEWGQGPNELSFARLQSLEKQLHEAQTAAHLAEQKQQQQQQQQQQSALQPPSPTSQPTTGDMTYATAYSTDDQPAAKGKSTTAVSTGKKSVPAATAPATNLANKKAALALKKKRRLQISEILNTLPLEYRGTQPDLQMSMEKIIENLMDSPEGLPREALISPPLIPQARAVKCLIALVTKKLVVKNNVGGTAFYVWVGP